MEILKECDSNIIQNDQFLTFAQVADRYPGFSEGSLRWLRFNGDINGFNSCIRKLGKRCLISTRSFELWVQSHKTV